MPESIAQLSHTEVSQYFAERMPDAVSSEDGGRIEYDGHAGRLWIDPNDTTNIVLAVDYATHVEIIKFSGLTEFFEDTSYYSEPAKRKPSPIAALGAHRHYAQA